MLSRGIARVARSTPGLDSSITCRRKRTSVKRNVQAMGWEARKGGQEEKAEFRKDHLRGEWQRGWTS